MTSNHPKSKRRSGAKAGQEPPEPIVFFVDRDLGKTFARKLRDAGVELRILDDFFAQHEPDDVWLAEVGRRGWFVISNDKRIRYNKLALVAIEEARVGVFLLASSGNLKAEEKARIFLNALPAMSRFIKKHNRPFIAKVRRDGVVLAWP